MSSSFDHVENFNGGDVRGKVVGFDKDGKPIFDSTGVSRLMEMKRQKQQGLFEDGKNKAGNDIMWDILLTVEPIAKAGDDRFWGNHLAYSRAEFIRQYAEPDHDPHLERIYH